MNYSNPRRCYRPAKCGSHWLIVKVLRNGNYKVIRKVRSFGMACKMRIDFLDSCEWRDIYYIWHSPYKYCMI